MNFPYLNETEELTDAVRSQADGSFIPLMDGITHYELFPRSSPLSRGERENIVLIHGFSVPYFIWDPTFAFLTQAGFRVLRYDLFGRGFSDRPHTRYDIDLYVRQLHNLLDTLCLHEKITLAGLSLGGAIAVNFMDRHPERVDKLILIDPAGAAAIRLTPLLNLVKLLVLPELILGLAGDDGLLKSIARDVYDPKLVDEFIDRYRPQMKIKGFKRALLSTVRSGMLGDFSAAFRRVGQQNKPTLLFWGRDDTTVPFEHCDLVRACIPQTEFHAIAGAGHIPHYEKPQEVNPILLEFLSRK